MFYIFSFFLQSLQWILFNYGVTIEPCLKFYAVPSQSQCMTLSSRSEILNVFVLNLHSVSCRKTFDWFESCLVWIDTVLWDIFALPSLKNMGIIFADFNFRARQGPRKIISILIRENLDWVAQLAFPSIDQLCGKKISGQNIWNSNGMKDTCSLTDKQTQRTYLHSDGWIKWLFRTKQWNLCLACLLRCVISQLVVYSECNPNILFNKETKTITCMSNTTTKEN